MSFQATADVQADSGLVAFFDSYLSMPPKPFHTLKLSYDRETQSVKLHPSNQTAQEWLVVNQDFVLATLRLVEAEFYGRKIELGSLKGCPTMQGAGHRIQQVFQAAYPHVVIALVVVY